MATKFYTLCRHTGPAQPFGTSEKITVPGVCPKCQILSSSQRLEVMMAVTKELLSSYRKIRTTNR